MSWFSTKEKSTKTIPWQKLTEMSQLQEILDNKSGEQHILFKHSTRCNISSIAFRRFETEWNEEYNSTHIWYLDLLVHRDISNSIAEKTGVYHQSPQVIALKNGEVIYTETHGQISSRVAVNSFKK
ncbi:MAG: bacillithiol system redox-active protein YtxJ [Flavobacteriales bacterium]|jgi:bacillithiol system protein YtxJ